MRAEEYDKLSEEEKRVKVAVLCGWAFEFGTRRSSYTDPTGYGGTYYPPEYAYEVIFKRIPDYLHDLNACHEFENGIPDKKKVRYALILDGLQASDGALCDIFTAKRATAAQRCKALVLTLTEEYEPLRTQEAGDAGPCYMKRPPPAESGGVDDSLTLHGADSGTIAHSYGNPEEFLDEALEALKHNKNQLARILDGVLSLNNPDDVEELLEDMDALRNQIANLEIVEE